MVIAIDKYDYGMFLKVRMYHYEKVLKASDIIWSVSISAVIWSSVLISVT